jgi:hypothetical protein
MADEIHTPVLIVGGGPVGLALATDLGAAPCRLPSLCWSSRASGSSTSAVWFWGENLATTASTRISHSA